MNENIEVEIEKIIKILRLMKKTDKGAFNKIIEELKRLQKEEENGTSKEIVEKILNEFDREVE